MPGPGAGDRREPAGRGGELDPSGSAAAGRGAAPVADPESGEGALAPGEDANDPPVVARLMVEIRSDGSRTVARGALGDEETGQRVAIEAKGSSPLEVAASLAKTVLRAPALARQQLRATGGEGARAGSGARAPGPGRRQGVLGRLRRGLGRWR